MCKEVKNFILMIAMLILVSGCEGETMSNKVTKHDVEGSVSNDVIDNLAGKKIYFGHQSVGFNILDGVNALLEQSPGHKLNIIKSKNPEIFKEAIFAHSPVGENSDPVLKINDFKSTIKNGIGNKADIAFFKFCYLDINKTTDIEKIFSEYTGTIEQLKKEFPKTIFAHVTVPLTVTKFTIKSYIKILLGRPDNNIMRNQFNTKLIAEYGGKDPIFNLAEIESTYPDGTRVSFTAKGKSYFSLAPEYAADNGHLNEIGKKVAAREFLKFLSAID